MRAILFAMLIALTTTNAEAFFWSTPKVDPEAVECMAKAIYFEAGSESQKGKIAVAKVVMNRVNSGGVYPDKVCDVVYQRNSDRRGCQFTWACRRNARIVSNDMYEEAKSIAEAVLEGKIKDDPSLGSISFNNAPFPGLRHHLKIGNHYFYKSRHIQIASGE